MPSPVTRKLTENERQAENKKMVVTKIRCKLKILFSMMSSKKSVRLIKDSFCKHGYKMPSVQGAH